MMRDDRQSSGCGCLIILLLIFFAIVAWIGEPSDHQPCDGTGTLDEILCH